MLCNRCRERGIFNVGQSLPSSLSLSTSHTVCGHIPYHTFLITHSIIYGRNNYPPVRGQLFPVPKSIVIKPLKQIHCNKFTSLDFNNSQEDSSIISARNLRTQYFDSVRQFFIKKMLQKWNKFLRIFITSLKKILQNLFHFFSIFFWWKIA